MRERLARIDWHAVPLLALLAVAAAASYGYHRLLMGQRDMVEHTYQVITTLEATLQRITDAETGQRGYLLTGRDSDLGPYQRALAEVPPQMAHLRALVADSPTQMQRADALDAALRRKFDELRASIALRRAQRADEAQALVLSDAGRIAMDTVRSVVAAMRGAEAQLLVRRSAQAHATERHLLAVTLACAALSVVARYGLARRERRRRAA